MHTTASLYSRKTIRKLRVFGNILVYVFLVFWLSGDIYLAPQIRVSFIAWT